MRNTWNTNLRIKSFAIMATIGMVFSILSIPIKVQAEINKVVVDTKEAFQTAITEKKAQIIELSESIDISGIGVMDVDNLTIDLNGNKLSASNFSAIFQGDNFKLMNGELDSKGGAYALFIGDERTTENILVENVKTAGGINAYNAHNITLRNVTATGTLYYAVWCDENAFVTIESGSYQTTGVAVLGTATPNDDLDVALTIKGGVFTTNQKPLVLEDGETRRKVVVAGGQFDTDPSKYLSEDYKVYQKEGQFIAAPTAAGITLDKDVVNIEKGKTITVTAAVEPSDTLDEVQWLTDNEKVASVENGVVTAKGAGTATITAKIGEHEASCLISVYEIDNPIISNGDGMVIDSIAKDIIKDQVNQIAADVKAGKTVTGVDFIDDEAKERFINATNISVEVVTNPLAENAVSTDDIAVIDTKLALISNDENSVWKVAQYLDVSILLKANQQTVGNITKLDHPITLIVNVSDQLVQKSSEFDILRVHGGEVDQLGSYKNGTVTFETDKFSTYALIYKDTKEAETDPDMIEVTLKTFIDGKEIHTSNEKVTTISLPIGKLTQKTLDELAALYAKTDTSHTLRGFYLDPDAKEKLQVGDEITAELKTLYMFIDSNDKTTNTEDINDTPNTSDSTTIGGFMLLATLNAAFLLFLSAGKKKAFFHK